MLKVIGLGYPRTGTMSLKHALEALGFGPCYHMIEVFDRPQDPEFWLSLLKSQGRPVRWADVFAEFRSTSDCPACCFWKQLWQEFPDARYILTVRDADEWYDSFRLTVYEAITHPERAPDEQHLAVQQMAQQLILDHLFAGRFDDREFAIDCYRQHNAMVQKTIPAERLLVLNVADGWTPLCRFLDVPTPEVPFPQSNTRSDFRERFAVPEGHATGG
ncbi:MAG: sulfotransferase [Planctomycetaceae bacterium]